jgi:transcriptional regulator with XRE-family HTH domain
MQWGKWIKEYRLRQSLTQEAFAELVGVDRTTVNRWENDIYPPAIVYRERLRELLKSIMPDPSMHSTDDVVRGIIGYIDRSFGLATLLDPNLRVVRTTKSHQQMSGLDGSEVCGQSSERFWPEAMVRIMKEVGGIKGYRDLGVMHMDLILYRPPSMAPDGTPIGAQISRGHTSAVGKPRSPACFLTEFIVESAGNVAPSCRIQTPDGVLVFDHLVQPAPHEFRKSA